MRSRLLAAAFVAALIAPATAADSVRGVTDNEVVIGTYTDLSGVTAMWGVNNSNAWRMVFDETNAAGGINGRKIKYIVEDNQYQVPRSVRGKQADQPRRRVRHGRQWRYADEQRHHARAAGKGCAERVPPDFGPLDV